MKDFFENLFILKGSLVKRYVRCSKAGCRCEKGYLHGPCYYFSYLKKGKIVQIYVPRDRVKEIKEGIRNYRLILKVLDEISLKNIKVLKRRRKNVKGSKVKKRGKNKNV